MFKLNGIYYELSKELIGPLNRFHLKLNENNLIKYKVNNLIKVWHAISFLPNPDL